jgi:hypothetical protein
MLVDLVEVLMKKFTPSGSHQGLQTHGRLRYLRMFVDELADIVRNPFEGNVTTASRDGVVNASDRRLELPSANHGGSRRNRSGSRSH